MVFDSLLPWIWPSSVPPGDFVDEDGGNGKKIPQRTRAGQATQNGAVERKHDGDGNYPGLVNISGTYCFMNSTLQAMASLSYLKPYVDAIHAKAEALDVPTPVIDALKELLEALNSPKPSPSSIRPTNIIQALTSHRNNSSTPSSSARSLFSSRDHQDAQELFQLLSEYIKAEATVVDKEGSRDRGLAAALGRSEEGTTNGVLCGIDDTSGSGASNGGISGVGTTSSGVGLARSSVFDGLTANRRSCMECGYTEAVMHFAFDSWQLAVPRMQAIALEDCLADYTRLELLTDCICRKCSLLATHKRLVKESEKLAEVISPISPRKKDSQTSRLNSLPNGYHAISNGNGNANGAAPSVSLSKKRRAKDLTKSIARVKAALEEGRIEDDLKDVRIEKVFSPMSTKQAMIARPPPVLALHINRSLHFGQYAAKNPVRIIFPEWLDLTPFTTSGSLSTKPSAPISTPLPSTPNALTPLSSSLSSSRSNSPFYLKEVSASKTREEPDKRSTTPTPADQVQRTIYRLMAVVCHFGQHSFGHYICYRRKPVSHTELSASSTSTDELAGLQNEISVGQSTNPGEGWLRVSDSSVREVGIESVLAEGGGAFMLYYERSLPPHRFRGGSSSSRSGTVSVSPSSSLTSSAFLSASSSLVGSSPLSSSPPSLCNSTLASSMKSSLSRSTTLSASSASLVGGGSLLVEQPSSDSEFEMEFGDGGGSKGGGVVYEQGDRSPSEETLRPSVVGVNENGGAVGIGVSNGNDHHRKPNGFANGTAIGAIDLKGKGRELKPGAGGIGLGLGNLSVGARVIRSVAAGLGSLDKDRKRSAKTSGLVGSISGIGNGSVNGVAYPKSNGNGNGHAPIVGKMKANGHQS